VCVELIEKVHDDVRLKGGCDDHDVLLVLSAMTAVRSTHLLPLHPRIRQLLKLQSTSISRASHLVNECGTINLNDMVISLPHANKLIEKRANKVLPVSCLL